MARVTSKLQVTIPKAVANEYGISPGDEIEFRPAGDTIRVETAGSPRPSPAQRLELFDAATLRQVSRHSATEASQPGDRGWRREDLYDDARAR